MLSCSVFISLPVGLNISDYFLAPHCTTLCPQCSHLPSAHHFAHSSADIFIPSAVKSIGTSPEYPAIFLPRATVGSFRGEWELKYYGKSIHGVPATVPPQAIDVWVC